MIFLNQRMCQYRISQWFISHLASPSALFWRKDNINRYLFYLAEGYFGTHLFVIELYVSDYDNCFTERLKDINIAVPAVLSSFFVTCHVRNERAFADCLYRIKLSNTNLTKHLRLESLADMVTNFQTFWETTLFQFAYIYQFSEDLATSIFMVNEFYLESAD